MKKIIFDLLPMKSDGSNGGNSVFILNLLNFFSKNYPDKIGIICKEDLTDFLKNNNQRLNQFHFFNSYEECLAPRNNLKSIIYIQIHKYLKFTHRVLVFFEKKISINNNFFLLKVFKKIFFCLVRLLELSIKNVSLLLTAKSNKNTILFSPFSHYDPLCQIFERKVFVIYDMQHRDLPQLHSPQEINVRDYHYSNAVKNGDLIITISEFSKRRIEETYSGYLKNIKKNKIAVIHLPYILKENKTSKQVINLRYFSNKITLNKNYFYTPANYWQHKNHKSLLVAILNFVKKYKDINFIFSGKFPDEYTKNELQKFIKFNRLQERVFLMDYVEENAVYHLYNNCLAIIAPSLYEGFGMTLKEASFSKKVSIVSDIPAHREIADPATTIFFNPKNPMDIAEKITSFFQMDINKLNFKELTEPELIYKKYSEYVLGNIS